MEKCTFQPRKALQMLDSQKRAREQAEKAEKKAREEAEKAEAAGVAKVKNRGEPEGKKTEDDDGLVLGARYATLSHYAY
jgi:hypothetical protein